MFNANPRNYLLAAILGGALSACGGGGVSSVTDVLATTLDHVMPISDINYQNVRSLSGTGYGLTLSPSDVRTHYSIPATLTGAGQTIAIVDAPSALSFTQTLADLNKFSTYYGLPLCNTSNPCLSQIDLSAGKLATAAADWSYEISLDTQWAHAIAPAAKIVLITAKSNAMTDMMAAIQTAAAQPGVVAISMSFGAAEFLAESSAAYDGVLQAIQAKGIVLLAASGDAGDKATTATQKWPSASPYVTSVGGSSIRTVGYALPTVATEVAWSLGGGGAAIYETMPAWQTAFLTANAAAVLALDKTKARLTPDVAYNADPTYSPVGIIRGGAWYAEGGTSAGAPQWAGITALIAQQRVVKNLSTLPALMQATANGFNGFIYQATLNTTSFFDITSGTDNTSTKACALCNAGKGYDSVTGLGVPNVTNLLTFF